MIDLHSHILPGVDDGARTIEESVEIGRMAEADGIEVMACTPHFMPGLYDNQSQDIRVRVKHLNEVFEREGLKLALVVGCDAHVRPDFVERLKAGDILTLHDSRYVLFEPPHSVMPQRLEDLLFNISVAGYVPILTHPERLKWIESNYATIEQLAKAGVWMQITSGSLSGRFGKRPLYWAERMLSEGLISILATDTHNTTSRPPFLAEAYENAKAKIGVEEANNLVVTRPALVLENAAPETVPPISFQPPDEVREGGFWRRLFGVSP